ncbi:MAG: putative metal-binding motif-containing protein, partial [Alphaproteobacteria bacterium]|nr:putative metal-binding motif-containing protein [Alphaproteobacteria bacterium]
MRYAPLLLLALLACRQKDVVLDSDPGVVDEDGDGVDATSDCDDNDPSAYPGNEETPYDGVDNDCDEATPDDDLDADGFGVDEDCDDTQAGVYPGAIEACDGIDNDCNGEVDDAVGGTWYADADGDGYGDPEVSTQDCDGEGLVADDSDCDDADAAVNPAADELCNDVDDDCDAAVDEGATDAPTWYADLDGDGFGDPDNTIESCEQPSGYLSDSSDCYDSDADVSPAATEYCDGIDNDCDGQTDEVDAADASTWYVDADGDGYGDPDNSSLACDAPSGHVADRTDCDDNEAAANPGETEVCDEIDNNCDGSVDEGVTTSFYADADGDGYGDASVVTEACAAPSGTVADSSDCDDAEPAANPGETEV